MLSQISSGQLAVKNGSNFEDFVNFYLCKYKQDYLYQYHIGETIYGTKRKVDFFVKPNLKYKNGLAIECKWQKSKGSVDEKYPYLCECIEYNRVPTIIIIDGGGYKLGAFNWLKKQVEKRKYLLNVCTMNEFQIETNNGLFF